MSGSPLVDGDLVYVNPGKGGKKAVIAYNRFTGEVVWAAGNDPASYAAPIIRRILGVRQLLIYHGNGLAAYDPLTGKELWQATGKEPWRKEGWTNFPKVNVALPIGAR